MSLAGGCGTEGVDDDVSSTWDDNGSLTDRGSDTFAWDYEDRMTSATVHSVTTTFAYRGDGLRDSRTTGGNTTTFTWDIAAGLPVVIDDGNQYVYGAGLEEMVAGGSAYYYLADGLGSTMAIVDSTGAVQKSYTYDVYGEATATGSLANEYDFAGQQTDPTGLQYLRARYMDPGTGALVSRDPLSLEPDWIGSPYAYADASPAVMIDPSGLFKMCTGVSNCYNAGKHKGAAVVDAGAGLAKETWNASKPYVVQCGVWGVQGAISGATKTGTWQGAAAGAGIGCAAGIGSEFLSGHAPDSVNPIGQCLNWGAAGAYDGGLWGAGVGCFFGGLAALAQGADGQCAVWGEWGAVGALRGPNLVRSVLGWSVSGCAAGAIGDWLHGEYKHPR